MALHGHTCGIRTAVPRRLCWSGKFILEWERMTGQEEGMRVKLVLSIYTYINFLSMFIYLYFNIDVFP